MKICKSEEEFISIVAPSAQKAGKRYNMLPSILIGQSALELGYAIEDYWDNESIADLLKYNNAVGQKKDLMSSSWYDYSVWDGRYFSKRTPEVYGGKKVTITDDFRIFDSIEQSYCDYILFLLYASNEGYHKTPKYGKAVVEIKDPETLIKTISMKGYATDPQYYKSVMRIVRKHNLTKYDDLSKVTPSNYVPESLKLKYGMMNSSVDKADQASSNVKKLVAPKFIDNRAASKSQVPAWRNKSDKKYIVLHYLGVVGQNFELWNNGYGATFTIAWNGDVYYTADYTAVTWQCGGGRQGQSGGTYLGKCTNYNSVSIETCVKRTDSKYEGDDNDDKWYFTEESQESLVWAVSKMMDDLNIPIDRVIRHYDVTGKICPNPFVRNNGRNGNWTWDQFKANLAQYRKDGTITVPNGSSSSPSSSSSSSSTKSYLSKGDSGDEVKKLQTMLNACGYNCGTVDGDFRSKTDAAVRKLQADTDLTVDGMYGVKTKGVLEEMYKNVTALKKVKTTPKKDTSGTVYNGVDYSPVYNYSYYRKKYSDLRKAFGTDKDAYFKHFCQYGMQEGRKASSAFDVLKYKARYEDLRKAFGDNLPEYYKHYVIFGKKEGRKAL